MVRKAGIYIEKEKLYNQEHFCNHCTDNSGNECSFAKISI